MSWRLRERPYPTGLTVFGPVPGADLTFVMWPGPGSGLFLVIGDPDTTEAGMARIERPSADGTYDTQVAARRAARAFIEAGGEATE